MPYVITDACVGNKDGACIDICPVDCIHPTPHESGYAQAPQLYINPSDCIDCGMCTDVCPPRAIYPESELPADKLHFVQINADHFKPRTP